VAWARRKFQQQFHDRIAQVGGPGWWVAGWCRWVGGGRAGSGDGRVGGWVAGWRGGFDASEVLFKRGRLIAVAVFATLRCLAAAMTTPDPAPPLLSLSSRPCCSWSSPSPKTPRPPPGPSSGRHPSGASWPHPTPPACIHASLPGLPARVVSRGLACLVLHCRCLMYWLAHSVVLCSSCQVPRPTDRTPFANPLPLPAAASRSRWCLMRQMPPTPRLCRQPPSSRHR
jgi:hypothetical protein